jgi:hypothetical protein
VCYGSIGDVTGANWHTLHTKISAHGQRLITIQPDNARCLRHAKSGKNYTAFSDKVEPRDVDCQAKLKTMSESTQLKEKDHVLVTRTYACGGAGDYA